MDISISRLKKITSGVWIRFPNMLRLLRLVSYECNTGTASTATRYNMQKYRNAFARYRTQSPEYFPSDIERNKLCYYKGNYNSFKRGCAQKLKNELKEWDKLEKEIKNNSPNRKIRIIHSEVQRAKHTALLIREILPVECELIGNSDLNCGKYRINEDLVKKIVSKGDSDNLVCIILSHQPDIELFCDKTLSTSKYLPVYPG